ncbi:hypothetical protein [Rufibacter roseus]|uniref:Uncharacterized protein n=1 Tax=Rufibacter roseus TaxID=1567108 RepID=A0ABW2DLS6_9BACT|nr:hypothetical protein [Rufibacter roseus]
MKGIILYATISFFLFSCRTSHKTERTALNREFKSNFTVLDSIAQEKKGIYTLNHKQISFLYLIGEWTGVEGSMDYTGVPKFTQNDLNFWKDWFKRNKANLSIADYQTTFNLYERIMKTSKILDSDLEYLEIIRKKYRQLK